MKKGLLLSLSLAVCVGSFAQVANRLPEGFRKAEVPAALKSQSIKVPYRSRAVDNGTPVNANLLPRVGAPQINAFNCPAEDLIGITFYDLQTNNSVSNRIVVNADGSISAAWTYSPDANQATNPPYPFRGTGYNYYDGTNWQIPYPGPTARTETARTGFTNILVCDNGEEMTVAHSAAPSGNFNRLALNRRDVKGTGAWTLTFPWGTTGNYDTWPKAIASGQNCYVIWQGSGAGTTGSPTPVVDGQTGPLYFSKSTDAGLNWSTRDVPDPIDFNFYSGFGGDSYGIDAMEYGGNSYVAISYADPLTDAGVLKSTDGGQTWTKTIIRTHPMPFYQIDQLTDTNADGDVDTLFTNSGDSRVLFDKNGMMHVWFSDFKWYDDDSTDDSYNYFPGGSDGLFYWNENMGPNNFVLIAAVQDLNGNGFLDTPADTTCSQAWGNYGGGLTQMPSAGIEDVSGTIYLSYQTIDETADTAFYKQAHRHVYMMSLAPPYDPTQWTLPYDIVPDTTISCGGDGYSQEAVFASTARRVTDSYAYVVYERDNAPGHGLAQAGTCDATNNLGNPSDIVVAKVDRIILDVERNPSNNVFVSQNYPNPTNSATQINITLKKSSDVRFEVYDMIGKVVYTEKRNKLNSGTHTVTLNTANWNAGIYTYTVIADGQKVTRQMIVQ